MVAYLRVTFRQRLEDASVEPQPGHLAAGPDRRKPGRLLEQSHLAEAVARLEDVERDLVASRSRLEDAGGAREDDVERVCVLAFADDRSPEAVRYRLEAVDDEA